MTLPEDLRGDGPCQDCDSLDNIVWFTDSALWNRVMGGPQATDDPGGILCVTCFVIRADGVGITPSGWYLGPQVPVAAADHHARFADGYDRATAVLTGVWSRSGSNAARWAADYLASDPDRWRHAEHCWHSAECSGSGPECEPDRLATKPEGDG